MDEQQPENVVTLDFRAKRLKTQVTNENRDKCEVFTRFLDAGVVSIAFDPRLPLVQVPSHFKNENKLILNFAHGYRLPDFTFDESGIGATLTFPQGYFYCFVPWSAIFSMHSEDLEQSAHWALSTFPITQKRPILTLIKEEPPSPID